MKLILPICLLAASQLLAAVPTAINYQGRLTDGDGNPASGSKTFSLKIHDAATGGNEIYSETIGSVVVDANGIYNFQFGANGSSVVDISDTVAVADGSATSYNGSLTSTPLTGTLSVTDGTYSWNIVDGNPGEQAAATAQIANGFVIGATVTNGGEGYTEAPSVTIDGDGSGATATAVVENGSLTAINIDTTGSGYTSVTVVIAEPSTPFVVDYGSGDVTVTYETAPPTATEITASYQASDSSIRGALSAADSHWLELTINGETQMPRERILSVPYAQIAASVGDIFSVIPAGVVLPYAGAAIPSGWALCDGAEVSRAAYNSLFAAIGTSHGHGDGSTTFNLPDYRGRFLRGVDHGASRDPDRASRSPMSEGGNSGDAVGSVQADEFKSHSHEIGRSENIDGRINHTNMYGPGSGQFSGNSGGAETRPVNANVNFIIKL